MRKQIDLNGADDAALRLRNILRGAYMKVQVTRLEIVAPPEKPRSPAKKPAPKRDKPAQ